MIRGYERESADPVRRNNEDRQKQQADQVRDMMAQQNAARAGNRPQKYPSAQEIDKMVSDRQKVSDELSRLTQQMRTSARELASSQPAASNKLRGALDGLDENDLGTRMQRSSDWLRGGKFSDQAEADLTSDLQKLGQQVGDAARALGHAQQASKDADLNRAMDDLSRLRDQLAGLGRDPNNAGRGGQPGSQRGQGQPGNQPGQGQSGRGGQQGQLGRDGQGGQNAQGGNTNGVGNRQAGPVRNPGGGAGNRDGSNYGGYDTGNTRITGQAVEYLRPMSADYATEHASYKHFEELGEERFSRVAARFYDSAQVLGREARGSKTRYRLRVTRENWNRLQAMLSEC